MTGPNETLEIERKFLVRSDDWRALARDAGEAIVQGYLSSEARATVRVRVGDRGAFLTIKGRSVGITTPEFEYEIPRDHAQALLELCGEDRIEKTRFRIPIDTHVFEVDVFEGANAGLVLAEVELRSENEPFPSPAWLGPEVSEDARFKNVRLAREPFRPGWGEEETT